MSVLCRSHCVWSLLLIISSGQQNPANQPVHILWKMVGLLVLSTRYWPLEEKWNAVNTPRKDFSHMYCTWIVLDHFSSLKPLAPTILYTKNRPSPAVSCTDGPKSWMPNIQGWSQIWSALQKSLLRNKHMYCIHIYTPEKLTWHWKIPFFNRNYIFKWWMSHCHVSFRGGIFYLNTLSETNTWHLKMGGWKSFLLGQKAYFQGELLVSGSVYIYIACMWHLLSDSDKNFVPFIYFIDVHCYLQACSWYWNIRMIITLKKRWIELCVLTFQLLVFKGIKNRSTNQLVKSSHWIAGSPHRTSWTMLDAKPVTWQPENRLAHVLAQLPICWWTTQKTNPLTIGEQHIHFIGE